MLLARARLLAVQISRDSPRVLDEQNLQKPRAGRVGHCPPYFAGLAGSGGLGMCTAGIRDAPGKGDRGDSPNGLKRDSQGSRSGDEGRTDSTVAGSLALLVAIRLLVDHTGSISDIFHSTDLVIASTTSEERPVIGSMRGQINQNPQPGPARARLALLV